MSATHRHYYASELIDLGDFDYATAFVAEGDTAWVTGVNGAVETWADPESAFAYLNGLRKRLPAGEHRAAVKNLARGLREHLDAARKAVA